MKLDRDIAEWAEAEWPDADLGRKFRKLGEEVGELGESLMRLQSDTSEINHTRHEIADCAIVLSHMATMLGAEGLYELMVPVFAARRHRESPLASDGELSQSGPQVARGPSGGPQVSEITAENGGADGTRTRTLEAPGTPEGHERTKTGPRSGPQVARKD
jgi:NTP pyrophosphatase (non-canonical NTP hydrolase)